MQRSRDLNLNVGLGNSNQYIPFYLLSADTLSSFNKEDAERNCKQYNERIVDIINIQMCTLKDILDKFSGSLKKIDFLSVDVEGFELDVLKGNDWNKYRPTLILIEININGERIISFLKENGYEIVFKNSTNGIFIDGRNLQRKI
jgi:FkbM family methyltransferase